MMVVDCKIIGRWIFEGPLSDCNIDFVFKYGK